MNTNIFHFLRSASGFLRRAKEDLRRFDDEADVASLFHAALALRMGIEARLYEYIEKALGDVKPEDSKIKDFEPSKLLKKLVELRPDAPDPVTHVIRRNDDPSVAFVFRYTPVSRAMAGLHGRLGGLLHYTYFWTHPEWYVKKESNPDRAEKWRSLSDAREFLAEVVVELEAAVAGNLLGHPDVVVTQFVRDIEAQEEEDPR